MDNHNYKLGIYATWSTECIAIGAGWADFGKEKYFHINLLFLEIAIGRTGK